MTYISTLPIRKAVGLYLHDMAHTLVLTVDHGSIAGGCDASRKPVNVFLPSRGEGMKNPPSTARMPVFRLCACLGVAEIEN